MRARHELPRRVGVGREGEGARGQVRVPAVLAEGVGGCGESVLTERDEEGGTVGEGLERGEGHTDSLAVDAMNPLVQALPAPGRRHTTPRISSWRGSRRLPR